MGIETILATFVLPAVVDLFKGAGGAISRKFFGLSVEDQLKIDGAAVERLKAIAELDKPFGTPSQWVVDLRVSFRYVAACIMVFAGLGMAAYSLVNNDPDSSMIGLQVAMHPMAFIFGERFWLGVKGTK